MTAFVTCPAAADPQEVWPGHAEINRTGAAIARALLCELESTDSDDGPNIGECSMLEDWARQGRPFRNVVAEYAAMAQAAGPSVLDGFYAVLSDYLAIACQGCIPSAERYDSHCEGIAEGSA